MKMKSTVIRPIDACNRAYESKKVGVTWLVLYISAENTFPINVPLTVSYREKTIQCLANIFNFPLFYKQLRYGTCRTAIIVSLCLHFG